MNTFTHQNPLLTVQLIPIFSYLNLLSDFLFIENYLTEVNQTKQIPVVNALYEYLEDHRFNQSMTDKLIRYLLKGSDLYGAKGNENFDVVFVNAMFDYIISSLVFDKYGNIYGFLVDVFCNAENLQIDYILDKIKENLQSASFENEYGGRSTLSLLSVNRIYNEIILPLFPQTERNLSLNSLDYIYAQAGLMFLRLGRTNTNYYNDFEHSNFENFNQDNLFDEYLTIGYLIEKLFLTANEKEHFHLLKSFAIPALSNYIFNNKYLFVYENTANIISDSTFWQEAFRNFFQFTFNAFDKTKDQLNNDYTLKMHIVLSRFRNRSTMAQIFIDYYCNDNITDKGKLLREYLNNPDDYECKIGRLLPNLNLWYVGQIKEITNMYKTFDLQLIQRAFGKSLIFYLERADVTIKLLRPFDDIEYSEFSTSKQISHDILEIYFSHNETFNYYALVRENYNVILINNAVNPELFREKIGKTIEDFHVVVSIMLKTSSQDLNEFWENLVEYKAKQLQLYLEFLDIHQEIDESWKSEWWKEFGLSLVPYYPCFTDTFNANHTFDMCGLIKNVKLFDKLQEDMLSKIVHTNTESMLSSLGTSIRSVILDNVCDEIVQDFVSLPKKYKQSIRNALIENEIFEDISLHIEDLSFELTFITPNDVNLLEKIVATLRRKTNLSLDFVQSKLDVIRTLKYNNIRNDVFLDEHKLHFVYVNSVNSSRTGYGYKFIFLSNNLTGIAHLRTDYELKNEILVTQVDFDGSEKRYVVLNATTLKPQPNSFMFEIDNRLRSKSTKVSFSGISVYHDDDKCDNMAYFRMSKYLNVCLRKWRLSEKLAFEKEAVKFIQSNTNLSQEQIKITLNQYTFPDNTTSMEFVQNWIESKKLQPPAWSNNYTIDNPDSFNILKYQLRLENHDVPDHDGEFRIKSIYSHRERRRIDKETPIKNFITDYNTQKAYYSATFEDYYAIRNFADTGYTRITGDTNEAKLMKLALYNLAIRQSDDPDEEFEPRLFRIESKPNDNVNNIFFKNTITLQKFTFAATSMEAATRFAVYPADKFINVLYEMEFHGPYLRAKIEQTYTCKENTVILLPGSEFLITERKQMVIKGLGMVLKIRLQLKFNVTEKHILYKKIMNEIAQIQF